MASREEDGWDKDRRRTVYDDEVSRVLEREKDGRRNPPSRGERVGEVMGRRCG